MGAGATEDTEVEVMVVSMVMDVVAEEDVVEGYTVKTHMNLPAGTENLHQKLVYNLKINGDSSTCNRRRIFNK